MLSQGGFGPSCNLRLAVSCFEDEILHNRKGTAAGYAQAKKLTRRKKVFADFGVDGFNAVGDFRQEAALGAVEISTSIFDGVEFDCLKLGVDGACHRVRIEDSADIQFWIIHKKPPL